MASEKLTIELQAKTNQLDAKLKSAKTELNELGDSADNTDTKFKKMSNSAGTFGKALGVASVAVTALTVGTVALIKQTTAYGRELKIASNISGVSTERLQSMAFATSTVGIGLEKLGDISKDTREKIGDFLNTGGGGFMDFVDAMKLTKEEATAVAKEFSTMAGPDILQEMVNRMEDAEVSAVQMSHALEGMASDTTNLIPLMTEGGKKAKELADGMSGVTVPLTAEDLKKLEDMDVALNLAGEAATNLATKSLVKLSDWFVNAANAASFFFASLNEGTRADLQTDLLPILESIQEVEQKLQTAGGAEENRLNRLLEKLKAEREEIRLALDALNNTAEAPALVSTEINGIENSSFVEDEINNKKAELREQNQQSIIDSFKTEEDLLHEKYERELEILGEHHELAKELEERYLDDLIAMDDEKNKKIEDNNKKLRDDENKAKAAQEKLNNKQNKTEEKAEKDKNKMMESNARSAMDLAAFVFEDNKAISAGIAVINTAEGITAALAKQNYAGAALTAAMGAAQISSILSASKGGGSVASVQSSVTPTGPDFVQDTDALQLTDSSASGSASNEIRFATDSGDELIDALASALNKGQSEGRF